MRLTQRIFELCLTSKIGVAPFAVIIEQGQYCSWAMSAGNNHELNKQWNQHVLKVKERNPEEWWVFDAWRKWFDEVSQETSDYRMSALIHLEKTTPGLIVKRPREVHTRLPVGAIALRWRRNRLFDRTEIIAAEIATILATGGTAHWNSSLSIDEHKPLNGDWIVEKETMSEMKKQSINGLVIIQAINCDQIEELKVQWNHTKETMRKKYPYSVAIVRKAAYTEISDIGCIIGEKFSSPVSLAVSVVRSKWSENYDNVESGGGVDALLV